MKMQRITIILAAATATLALAEVRVQDIARLQGQRTNKLMGYGLVVGLNGTGDGEKYAPTMRALMRLHERFHAPVLDGLEIKGNKSVALVTVEAEVPEFGAREGQSIDVQIAAIGAAKSLKGGQLLTTPLQYAMFNDDDPETQYILALAGGRVIVLDEKEPTRGSIRGGATLEEDMVYSFIDGDRVTLVLDDEHAGWTWSQMIARAVNHELASTMSLLGSDPNAAAPAVQVAIADGPKSVVVQIPRYELSNPASYIARVLQTPLFMLPEQAARVVINRAAKSVSFTGAVRVSPTTVTIAGLGTIALGVKSVDQPKATTQPAAPKDAAKPDKPDKAALIEFSELMEALSAVKASPDQIIGAVESLHRSGTLHARLVYE